MIKKDEDRIYELALSMIKHIGGQRARQLVSYCGSAEAVLKESKSKLLKIPGISIKLVEGIKDPFVLEKAEKELEFVYRKDIKLIYYLDEEYPYRLSNFEDSPIVLFYKGNTDLNKAKHISIVGTRTPSERGKWICEKIVEDLKPYNPVIFSGLAYGIDTKAHKSSVENGLATIGVVAHGLDIIYPRANSKLVSEMIENGGVLTEFPSNTIPDRDRFPARNRIIAAICDALIVVESRESGGSMITANFANEYGKDVFAIPGRISDENSKGCHQLIKDHKAFLMEEVSDLVQLMRWDDKKSEVKQTSLFESLDEKEKAIIQCLKSGINHIDGIIEKLGIESHKLSPILLSLEFKGMLKAIPGKRFMLIH